MVNAFDPNAVVEYIPKADRERPDTERTTFLLKPLSIFDKLDVEEEYQRIGEQKPKRFALYYVRKSLVGWRGFRLASGASAQFEADASGLPTDQTLALVGEFAGELFDAALAANRVTVEQTGKS